MPRYSQLYVERGQRLTDSEKARRRLWAFYYANSRGLYNNTVLYNQIQVELEHFQNEPPYPAAVR
jgi:hypothetical protein